MFSAKRLTPVMPDLKSIVAKLANNENLTRTESQSAFDIIMSGEATPTQIGGILMALRVKGETVEEISGAVQSLRSKMTTVSAPKNSIDIVGTGGDGHGTYNISTAVAFVVAGCGIPVAKHGNRNVSSKSGAADVLTKLGVKIDICSDKISECIQEAGIGFLFAPQHHPAMRFVGPSRQELGTRTIFNVLGPLCNPAGVKRHLIGVYSKHLVEPVANVLKELGSKHLWVVHGADGMDEITTTGTTFVAELCNNEINTFEISPTKVGLNTVGISDLKGEDADKNAEALKGILAGEINAYRDIVLMNASAALIVADQANSLEHGIKLATEAIENRSALNCLNKLIETSNT